MNKEIPEEPKFVRQITSFQKVLAGVVVTSILVVYITSWDIVIGIFKPDYIKALTFFRVVIAIFALGTTSIVGYRQIGSIMKYILEVYEFYKTMSEIKKKKEGE